MKKKFRVLERLELERGNCPRCGEHLNGHTCVHSQEDIKNQRALAPDESLLLTVAVCIHCGSLLVLDLEGNAPLREVALHELTTLRGVQPEFYRHVMAAKEAWEHMRRTHVPEWMRKFLKP